MTGGFPQRGLSARLPQDPGTAYVEIYDVKDLDVTKSCGFLPATPGARKIGVVIAWTEGTKVDLAKLKGGKEPEMFVMSSTDDPKKRDRKDVQKDFKPTGAIEILKAPKSKGEVGRIKIEMTSGKDKLQGRSTSTSWPPHFDPGLREVRPRGMSADRSFREPARHRTPPSRDVLASLGALEASWLVGSRGSAARRRRSRSLRSPCSSWSRRSSSARAFAIATE